MFLFKGCSADEYDWHLQPPLDFQLKPLEWRRSWDAKGRAVFSFGLLGGWLSCGFMLLLPRIFRSEWEQGLWKPCWEEVYFQNPSWNFATNSLYFQLLFKKKIFFFFPFFFFFSPMSLCAAGLWARGGYFYMASHLGICCEPRLFADSLGSGDNLACRESDGRRSLSRSHGWKLAYSLLFPFPRCWC